MHPMNLFIKYRINLIARLDSMPEFQIQINKLTYRMLHHAGCLKTSLKYKCMDKNCLLDKYCRIIKYWLRNKMFYFQLKIYIFMRKSPVLLKKYLERFIIFVMEKFPVLKKYLKTLHLSQGNSQFPKDLILSCDELNKSSIYINFLLPRY